MAFVLQRIDGARIVLSEVRERTLRIGRGANAHIRSENASVALDHAAIEQDETGYVLIDHGSITGTYLNGRTVETARLTKGDAIEIGDVRISVEAAVPGRPLFLGVRSQAELSERFATEDAEEKKVAVPVGKGRALAAQTFDFVKAYSVRRSAISLTVVTLLAVSIAVMALTRGVLSGWESLMMPGPLSAAHSRAADPNGVPLMLRDQCSACHTPFRGASNEKCQSCHRQTFHQVRMAALGSCIQCHPEHRTVSHLAELQQQVCLDCHRDLRRRFPGAMIPGRVTGFGVDHPEIQLLAEERSSTSLKFDHECHLTGDCTAQNLGSHKTGEKLDCLSCHQIDASNGSIRPISFERSCERCHQLTFDNRFPPVPHGVSADAVAGVIANAYSRDPGLLTASPDEMTRIFARRAATAPNVESVAIRNAQRTIQVRCGACHEMRSDGVTVIPPIIRRRWFPAIRPFSHTVHLDRTQLRCTDCHETIMASRRTEEISMPTSATCAACHSARLARGALSNCTTCHFYHQSSAKFGPGWSRGRMAGQS